MENGDPIVRQIVNKLYGSGDEVLESVVIKESEVIVSRETLDLLVWMATEFSYNAVLTAEEQTAIKEARRVLGDA